MISHIGPPRGLWLVFLLSVVSFGATSDVRLVEAVKNHDVKTALLLLTRHAGVNTPGADGATALH